MNRQSHHQTLKNDLSRLRHLLNHSLSQHSHRHRSLKDNELRILNLACGSCDEAETLVESLPRLLSHSPTPAKTSLLGVDLRQREISDASTRCRDWLKNNPASSKSSSPHPRASSAPLPEFEFLAGDATRLSAHHEIGDNFDVVFLRHQNYWNGDHTWKEIFNQGLEKLSPDGLLICTSYFDREHKLALKAIEELGAKVIHTSENPDGRRLSTPGKVVDKHIALIRKPA